MSRRGRIVLLLVEISKDVTKKSCTDNKFLVLELVSVIQGVP